MHTYKQRILHFSPTRDATNAKITIPVSFFEFISNIHLKGGLLRLIKLHSDYQRKNIGKKAKITLENTHDKLYSMYGSCIQYLHLETPWYPGLTRIIFDEERFNLLNK